MDSSERSRAVGVEELYRRRCEQGAAGASNVPRLQKWKKKYERQFVERGFLLSDVQREETPKEGASASSAALCVRVREEGGAPGRLDAGAVERRQIAAQPSSSALTSLGEIRCVNVSPRGKSETQTQCHAQRALAKESSKSSVTDQRGDAVVHAAV